MGKDWYWGARKSSKKTTPQTDIPPGCMCALFQTFDFHPFHFSINQPQHHSPVNSISKEPEAPRNSLESQDEENFKIPKNIRTRGGSFNDLSSDVSSPGTKTPTLVARLMGLDLLPDANSPSSSSSSSLSTPNRQSLYHSRPKPENIKIMKHRHSTDSVIIRSLPETPRLSSERTSSFVEHRLSLQINKENMNHGEDLETPPRFSFSKLRKHVKERVGGRKVGKDITNNTIKNTKEQEQEKEDFVGQIKFKKPLKPLKPLEESNQGKHSNTSHSPRLSRFNDNNNNNKHSPTLKDQNTHQVLKQSSPPPLVNIEAHVSRVSTKTKTQAMSEKEMMMKDTKYFPKCKKTAAHGNLSPLINKNQQTTIRNKQQESFIIRPSSSTTKAKRTHPLSNNIVPNFLPLKTHPSPPDTKIPQKQVNDDVPESKNMSQLFSSSRQKYTLYNQRTNDESKSNSSVFAAGTDEEPEYQYISTILNRTGIHKATITNLQHFQWFSSTHPLDPSIFHRLELYPDNKDNKFTQKNHPGPRCNRRLLFDLLDEVLSEILMKPNSNRGLLSLDTVWKRVRSFPRAKCEVLEDIDGLIEMKDLMDKNKEEEEEGEKLVTEIEGKVLEMLVNETITVMVGPNR